MRVLILGGTTEANALARALAGCGDLVPLLSLAGRTADPALPPIASRMGGFGGAPGLTRFLREEAIGALVDATHPFAAQISTHAATAAAEAKVPIARLTRPPWRPRPEDLWHSVPSLAAAAAALGPASQRVFLTIGRLGIAAFRAAPHHHYLIRSIDPPAAQDLPPEARVILGRGPFDEAAEGRLLDEARIEVLVTKNSGGDGTAAKLAAARARRLPVVMVDPPPEPRGLPSFTAVGDVLRWLEDHRSSVADP